MSEAIWGAFAEKLQVKNFRKGDFLTDVGKVERYIYFINSGATRSFFLHDGKELTVDFHFPGEFITAYQSFITREPSKVSIELLGDGELVAIFHADLYHFYSQNPDGERVGRLMAEYQYIRRLQKEMDMLSFTAEERYKRLLERNPHLVQSISVKHLSSYLGIQPESLSRIRKLHSKS